jgi:DNA-binding PadR family transcriptional regulator
MASLTLQTQAVLSALVQDVANPHYGLEIGREIGLPSGTIYPILARLERVGWVRSEVEQIDPRVEGRRARRYYKLTGEGERVARAEIAQTLERVRPAPERAPSIPDRVPSARGVRSA